MQSLCPDAADGAIVLASINTAVARNSPVRSHPSHQAGQHVALGLAAAAALAEMVARDKTQRDVLSGLMRRA